LLLILLVEFFSYGSELTPFELGDLDRAPSLGSTDERTEHREVLELLENWRGASFAIVNQQTDFGEPGRGAPHGDKITCFAAHA